MYLGLVPAKPKIPQNRHNVCTTPDGSETILTLTRVLDDSLDTGFLYIYKNVDEVFCRIPVSRLDSSRINIGSSAKMP